MLHPIVESANARIKNIYKFSIMSSKNKYLNSIGDLLAIACSLINKYRPSIVYNKPEYHQLAQRMLQRMDLSNLLQEFVEMNFLNTQKSHLDFS
jgi:subtilase family serine protease